MADASPHEVLERAAWLLHASWRQDVLPLRASRLLHERVRPFLGKLEIDGHVVGRLWYQDHVLASIRRMVDKGRDVVSIRKALIDVRQVADDLTPAVLLNFHGPNPKWGKELNLRMSAEWVRLTVTRARPEEPEADTSVIGKRTVQADLDRIRNVADRAHRLATIVTAHRLDLEEKVVVTDEDVEQLLEDISAIYVRWSLPLRGVDVETSIDHFQVGDRMAEALQLYNRKALSEAIREHLEALEFGEQVPSRRELLKRMRADYHIGGQSGEAGAIT